VLTILNKESAPVGSAERRVAEMETRKDGFAVEIP
jgi:hypothetical protein